MSEGKHTTDEFIGNIKVTISDREVRVWLCDEKGCQFRLKAIGDVVRTSGMDVTITTKDHSHDALVEALEEIRDAEDRCCPRCEGNGNLYADGKTHLMSENAPTMACGNCGGSGRLQPENAQDVAAVVLAKEKP